MNPLPSASGTVDPWPEIIHIIPQKITYKGAPVAGDANTIKGFAGWLIQSLPAVCASGDAETKANCLLQWLRSETHYEADQATRMQQQAQVQQPPSNPISSQTVPQQAQMAPPTPQPVAAPAPAAESEEAGPGMTCPECGTKVSGMRGYKRHTTMTHKVDWSAFCTKHGLDQKTGLPGATPAAAPAQPQQIPPAPIASPVPPMFQASGPAAPFVAPAPPPMPSPAASVAAAPSVPTMGMAVAPQPIPSHAPPAPPMVAFDPNAPVPGQQTIPFQQPAPVQPQFQYPQQPQAVIPQAAPAQAAPAQAPVQAGGPTREDLARMLGGAVDLIVVRLLDAATVNLQGRVDVNQIAAVAESRARTEMKVADLAQSSYGQGKQAAQRHFAEILTQTPGCYLLLNGYEPILPSGYLEILAARVTKFHVVTDSGRQTTTIF